MTGEQCSWCGAAVPGDDGYRAFEPAGERAAVFCRLEHVVPWAIQGAHWSVGVVPPRELRDGLEPACALCGEPLGDTEVLLVRHRGEHRIADGFCGVAHLLEWAKAGGRWQ
ncbi:MAG TPA: hypothetical protein VMT10_00375 [Solirubrobacteraceae bacterium]|nr:hypothetical protein [Solirubrobacteraceae bacterium]